MSTGHARTLFPPPRVRPQASAIPRAKLHAALHMSTLPSPYTHYRYGCLERTENFSDQCLSLAKGPRLCLSSTLSGYLAASL